MSRMREIEAIRIYILPEKEGGYSWRVFPPASLSGREKELPFYGEHGFQLKNWEQLRSWVEEVSRLKLQSWQV